jgi:hypothetical protein
MIRLLMLVCFSVFLPGPPVRDTADQYAIALKEGGGLRVVMGKVRWIKDGKPAGLWLIEKTGKGYTVRIRSDGKWNKWHLTFDPSGKSKHVYLSEKPTPGSYWWVPDSGRGSSMGTIRPVVERFSSWGLDTGAEDPKLGGKGVVLAKRGKQCEVTVIAP